MRYDALRRSLSLLIIVLAVALFAVIPASAEIVKVTLDNDEIQPVTDEYISRAIDHAAQVKASAVLIELRTPGGLETSMRHIVEKILNSPVPVIVYVAPSGGRAASAGFFILQAADVAAMAPGTNTGSAHPVKISGADIPGDMRKKVENDSAAFLRSYVSKRGRNVELAESAIRESKAWSADEALKEKLIDVVAADQSDLFKQLQGRAITRFSGGKVELNLVGQPVSDFQMTLKQRVQNFILDPNIAFILLAVGLLALYAEFNHPGAVIPGVVGGICILLAVFALNVLPTRLGGIVLILAAFVFFALEAKFTSHGLLTVGGIACMVVGALLLIDSPMPEMRVKLITALAVSVPLGVITAFLMSIALRARRNKVATGVQGLIGEIGVTRSRLVPQGKVFVRGELWDAISPVEVAEGDRIVIRAVEGLTLRVEPISAAQLSQQQLHVKS